MTTASASAAPGVLLVHGLWHGSWCWSQTAAGLAAARHRVLAVDLVGHGLNARRPLAATTRPHDPAAYGSEVSPVAHVDLDLAGELLVAQIEQFAGDEPVVVVGHSFGGVVVSRAVQAVPHLVSRAVYVAAFMPASGVPGLVYLQSPEQDGDKVAPLALSDPAAVGALRIDPQGDADYRARLREAFYGDVDPALADAALALLSPDGPAGLAAGQTVLTREGWGGVPRTYVHCSRDYAVRPLLQRRFVREADEAFPDNPTHTVELDTCHSPFLSMPATLSQVISDAATRDQRL